MNMFIKRYKNVIKTITINLFFMLMLSPQIISSATITVPTDYATVGEAVFNATTGDTVFIQNGIYIEPTNYSSQYVTMFINVNKPNLSIEGESQDGVIICPGVSTWTDPATLIAIGADGTASGCTITNLTIEGSGYLRIGGWIAGLDGTNVTCDNVTISNVTFQNSCYGLEIGRNAGYQTSNATINNCTFHKHQDFSPLTLSSCGLLIVKDVPNLIVSNCVFNDIQHIGIESQETSGSITISNNTFSNISEIDVYTMSWIDPSASTTPANTDPFIFTNNTFNSLNQAIYWGNQNSSSADPPIDPTTSPVINGTVYLNDNIFNFTGTLTDDTQQNLEKAAITLNNAQNFQIEYNLIQGYGVSIRTLNDPNIIATNNIAYSNSIDCLYNIDDAGYVAGTNNYDQNYFGDMNFPDVSDDGIAEGTYTILNYQNTEPLAIITADNITITAELITSIASNNNANRTPIPHKSTIIFIALSLLFSIFILRIKKVLFKYLALFIIISCCCTFLLSCFGGASVENFKKLMEKNEDEVIYQYKLPSTQQDIVVTNHSLFTLDDLAISGTFSNGSHVLTTNDILTQNTISITSESSSTIAFDTNKIFDIEEGNYTGTMTITNGKLIEEIQVSMIFPDKPQQEE